ELLLFLVPGANVSGWSYAAPSHSYIDARPRPTWLRLGQAKNCPHGKPRIPILSRDGRPRRQCQLPRRGRLAPQIRTVLSGRLPGRDLPGGGAIVQGAGPPRVAKPARPGRFSQAAGARGVPADRRHRRSDRIAYQPAVFFRKDGVARCREDGRRCTAVRDRALCLSVGPRFATAQIRGLGPGGGRPTPPSDTGADLAAGDSVRLHRTARQAPVSQTDGDTQGGAGLWIRSRLPAPAGLEHLSIPAEVRGHHPPRPGPQAGIQGTRHDRCPVLHLGAGLARVRALRHDPGKLRPQGANCSDPTSPILVRPWRCAAASAAATVSYLAAR